MHSISYRYTSSRWKIAIAVALTITTILLFCFHHDLGSTWSRPMSTLASNDSSHPLHDALYTHNTTSSYSIVIPTSSPSPYTPSALPQDLYNVLKPRIHPITAETFTSRTGQVYNLPGNARFTQPLGKRILILDAESRDLDSPGGLLDESRPVTDDLQGLTLGRLNHYMFAMLHGYDYKLVQYPDDPTLHGTWNKVPAMRDAIEEYEYVVFMDGDAIFTHPHLPLEWLLNYWEVTNETTMALAEDPGDSFYLNAKKLDINLNTGFVIAHKTLKSDEFFEAWLTCPDETRYKDCGQWRLKHTHEQAVVNEYLRYDYPEEIKILPCTEANRFPGSPDCQGEFVAHYWPHKKMLPDGAKEVMEQYFWPSLQTAYSEHRDDLVVDRRVKGSQGVAGNPDANELRGEES